MHHARVRDEGPPANFGIALVMSDRDVVERFAEIFGGNVTRQKPPRYKPNWNETWAWMATGDRARAALEVLLPQLGERRRAKALEKMEAFDAYREEVTRAKPVRDAASCSVEYTSMSARQMFCSKNCSAAFRAGGSSGCGL